MSRIMEFFNSKIMILLLTALIQTGCWGARELNDLAILAGTGIDIEKETGKFLFTAQIIIPENLKQSAGGGMQGGGSSGMGSSVRVGTSTGDTVFEAIRNFIPHGSRRVYFAHGKVL